MRPILKFRAWVKTSPSKSNKMIQVKGFDFGSNYITDNATHGRYSIIGNVLMQYIGLKDRNGVEVYDGDIYRNLDSGLIGKLSLDEGVGGIYVQCSEYKDGHIWTHLPFMQLDTTNFEVIGNIYENPGLLEDETRVV